MFAASIEMHVKDVVVLRIAWLKSIENRDIDVYKSDMDPKPRIYMPHWEVLANGYIELGDWDIGHILVPCWRLYWGEPAYAWLERRGRRWDLQPDQLLVIAPYTRIESGVSETCRHFWIHFTASSPYDFVSDWIGAVPLSDSGRKELVALAVEFGNKGSFSAPFGTRLSSLISLGMSAVPDDLLGMVRLEPRVDTALRLMRKALAMPIQELARQAGLSPRALDRLFAETLGQSPKRVQSMLRMNRAELKLVYSDDSIEAISELCGFHDRAHFSRVFGDAHGLGPASYRSRGQLSKPDRTSSRIVNI